MESIWKEFSVVEGMDEPVVIGDLDLRIVERDGDVRLHIDGRALENRVIISGWRDISLTENARISLVPRTPDLPIVLRPDEPVDLGINARFDFRVLLPAWVEVRYDSGPARKTVGGALYDLPTHSIKRSWFGTPESGEVAYTWPFSPSSIRRYQKHLISVPVSIINNSSSVLHFERFLLRVVHLSVYLVDSRLSTNTVTVLFKGSEQMSQISFQSNDSVIRKGGVFLSGPRENIGADMIRKSFSWLKELAI